MKHLSFILALSSASSLLLKAGDDFEDATPVEFTAAQITATLAGTTAGTSAEDNEPDHAGIPANHSFWYALTVDEARRVELAGLPEAAANTVVAVYTGTTLADLQVVSRYANFDLPASSRSRHPGGEPFTKNVRVVFDAEPGTTYFIAIDGENNTQAAYNLTLLTSRDSLTPEFELIPAESEWSYYQALDLTVPTAATILNPTIDDPDFYTTWHTVEGYDGPAFSEPGNAPFAYGTIDGENAIASTLITPATNNRQATTYFRSTFTPERGVQELGFEGLIDDGAIIYINGTEVARINMAGGADTYISTAINANITPAPPAPLSASSERAIQYATAGGLDLKAGEEVEIGVSLHNASATSSDANFHMRVYATKADPLPAVVTLEETDFKDTYRLVWNARKGFSYRVEFTNTSLDEGSWQEEIQGTDTPDEDGPLDRFVLSSFRESYWRVITTPAEE